MAQFLILQFSKVESFEHAKSLAGELLDIYITHGVRLAWMMVTRIPPMIASKPTPCDPDSTILEYCKQTEFTSQQVISLRPVLYFSYEGEVAVRGIVTSLRTSSRMQDSTNDYNEDTMVASAASTTNSISTKQEDFKHDDSHRATGDTHSKHHSFKKPQVVK